MSLEDSSTPELVQRLIVALQKEDVDEVRAALDAGADPNARDSRGWAVMSFACGSDTLHLFDLLVERGADPLAEVQISDESGGIKLLHLVAQNGLAPWVAKLLALGADPNGLTDDWRAPLHGAAKRGSVEVCRMLLDVGAKPSQVCKPRGQDMYYTPLHFAVRSNHPAVVRLLVERGADLHATAQMGRTSLHVAAELGMVAMCRDLIALGATPADTPKSVAYDWYLTPFQFAVEKGCEDVAAMFMLECGESLKQKTLGGKTIAQLAKKHAGLYQRLLSRVRSEVSTQRVGDWVGVAQGDQAGAEVSVRARRSEPFAGVL
jgi:ankyrin repeat protein